MLRFLDKYLVIYKFNTMDSACCWSCYPLHSIFKSEKTLYVHYLFADLQSSKEYNRNDIFILKNLVPVKVYWYLWSFCYIVLYIKFHSIWYKWKLYVKHYINFLYSKACWTIEDFTHKALPTYNLDMWFTWESSSLPLWTLWQCLLY